MQGNYVAVNCQSNAFDLLGVDKAALGYEPHITLMWSPDTTLDHAMLKELVENMSAFKMAQSIALRPTGVDMFTNNNGGYSVVLVVDHGCLRYVNQMLTLRGLKHSFTPYTPHMSLTYNTPIQEAEELKRIVELALDKITIQLTDVVAEDTQ